MERKDLAWERWYDLTSQEIGEMIKAPKLGKTVRLPLSAQTESHSTAENKCFRSSAAGTAQSPPSLLVTTQTGLPAVSIAAPPMPAGF